MPRKKKVQLKDSSNIALNMGSLSFIGILIISAIVSLFTIPVEYSTIPILLLGLLGAIIAIDNITKSEELLFMLACVTIILVGLAITSYILLPDPLRLFIANLSVALGIAGFIVALGAILKLGWTR